MVGEAPPIPSIDPSLPRPIVRKEGTFIPSPTDKAMAGWIRYMSDEYPGLCKASMDAQTRVAEAALWEPWRVGAVLGLTVVIVVPVAFLVGHLMR